MDATKKITKNLGGDRLGSGNKNNISMHAYNRSTHDLSRAWRSTMNVGTLVPFFKEPALNGETWSIDLEALVRTVPTVGPIYGSFKLQLDMFVCPMRLYNGLLHNNMTKIGLRMDQVKLPKLTINSRIDNLYTTNIEDLANSQINPSSLEKYLGLSGIGDVKLLESKYGTYDISRKFQCVPELAYYDIYKNYYANKQEEKGVIIANGGTLQGGIYGEISRTVNVFQQLETKQLSQPGNYTWLNVTLDGNTTQKIDDVDNINNLGMHLEGTSVYSMPLPANAQSVISFIVARRTVGQGVIMKTWTKHDIGTLFPDAEWVDNQLILGTVDSAYISQTDDDYYIAGINYNRIAQYQDGIQLQVFSLENIDDARISILRDTGLNNEWTMNSLNEYPYKALWEQDSNYRTGNLHSQQGLAIKTYQSDLLQNWLQTEWIDGTNGINQITAIDVSSGSFTLDALNLANKVYNMLNRIAVSGGTYEDWQEAVYSTEAVRRAEQPIYVGGMSCEICFEEVVATTAAEDQPLGTLGGKGVVANKRGGNLEIRVDEPSYIMGIVSITPRLDYSQGNDWDRAEIDNMDDWHKPALDGIGFEDLLQERGAWWGTYYDTDTQEWVKLALGKTPAWINYMTSINKCFGDFAIPTKQMWMTLNRQYEWDKETVNNLQRTFGITDATTYIDPTKYNYAFADKDLSAQNFWVQVGIKAVSRRVMSAKQIPSL